MFRPTCHSTVIEYAMSSLRVKESTCVERERSARTNPIGLEDEEQPDQDRQEQQDDGEDDTTQAHALLGWRRLAERAFFGVVWFLHRWLTLAAPGLPRPTTVAAVTSHLVPRPWVPDASETLVQQIAAATAASDISALDARIQSLLSENRHIHETQCLNLNPATNVMNPKAEAALSAGLGSRPSLGYPGEKYEMGLEAIEQIEVIAAELAAEVFNASYAEIRVPSGALANLYAFMALANAGDSIIAPPPSIGGHVTHHDAGVAGLYGLKIHEAPIDAANYTIDVDALAALAKEVQPKVITVGASLNLTHHPVAAIREVADSVGAKVLFDAAHLSGTIAGGAWPNPLDEGAHLVSMSAYKSLAGPASGLIVTNNAEIAESLDAIAYPGLTANFDAAKTASLAITLLDWKAHGRDYATEMVKSASTLADALSARGLDVYSGTTQSQAFAIDASPWGGGHAAALRLRDANLLTCAIGLPTSLDAGLRIGTNEIVRWGMTTETMAELADAISAGLHDPLSAIDHVANLRARFQTLHFINE